MAQALEDDPPLGQGQDTLNDRSRQPSEGTGRSEDDEGRSAGPSTSLNTLKSTARSPYTHGPQVTYRDNF